jgi:hypothetical protein
MVSSSGRRQPEENNGRAPSPLLPGPSPSFRSPVKPLHEKKLRILERLEVPKPKKQIRGLASRPATTTASVFGRGCASSTQAKAKAHWLAPVNYAVQLKTSSTPLVSSWIHLKSDDLKTFLFSAVNMKISTPLRKEISRTTEINIQIIALT